IYGDTQKLTSGSVLARAPLALLHARVDDAAVARPFALVRPADTQPQLRVWHRLEVDRLAQTLRRHGQRVHLAGPALQALALLDLGVDASDGFLARGHLRGGRGGGSASRRRRLTV